MLGFTSVSYKRLPLELGSITAVMYHEQRSNRLWKPCLRTAEKSSICSTEVKTLLGTVYMAFAVQDVKLAFDVIFTSC